MKTIFLFITVLFLASFEKTLAQSVNIFDAIKSKQISVTATSNGEHSGEAILLEINKLKNISGILIPPGTRFKSEFEEDQDLLTLEEELIVLNSTSNQYLIKGFCVEPQNSSPTEGSQFTILKEGDLKLNKIAKYLGNKDFNDGTKQTALWCVAGDDDVSGIYEDGNDEVKNLREYVCSLTGKENVWYNTDPVYTVDENRNIVQETTKIEGLLSYKVTKTGNMTMEVLGEDGELFQALGGEMPVSRTGDYSFNFKLSVRGWRSGKYSVQLKIGNEVIHKEDFVIA
ncbi:hypothetical protein [Brumimicrobium oceani]|uniref:Uncharacterized protein n=1 Tax=Brumimicrobium oceani TaxID=2100725 RepID=A0A2U2XCR0_9FLAO|nr:hypothetical protein [Brumimicrobium oceani]PWH85589.1 hypothetical protein DIT68_08085 [Brumimicrobium oceani]